MDVKFYLKDPQKKEDTAIYCLCHFGYKENTSSGIKKHKPVKIYTEKKIKPKYWNPKKNRARESDEFPQYPEFNKGLTSIENDLKGLYEKLKNHHKVVTPEMYKKAWVDMNNPTPLDRENTNNFAVFAEKHIKSITGSVKKSTLKSFRNSLGHIKEFAIAKKMSLDIDTIGFDFHFSMVEYLKNEKKFGTNTIWRINKFLRYILKFAAEKGLKVRPDYQSKRFAIKSFEPDVIYLNEKELKQIYSKDIKNKKLERVKDLFLIGCYTGLRFSDFNRLNPTNIKEIEGKKYFSVTTQKTGEPVLIPLHPIVLEIIDKYAGIPKGMSNQKFNDYIKDVVELAEIKDKIVLHETKGNLTAPMTYNKWDLVTSHTARRSFATNAFKAGLPVINIMLITGHRTESAFMRYIRISKEENAVLMSNHPFFNSQILKAAK